MTTAKTTSRAKPKPARPEYVVQLVSQQRARNMNPRAKRRPPPLACYDIWHLNELVAGNVPAHMVDEMVDAHYEHTYTFGTPDPKIRVKSSSFVVKVEDDAYSDDVEYYP